MDIDRPNHAGRSVHTKILRFEHVVAEDAHGRYSGILTGGSMDHRHRDQEPLLGHSMNRQNTGDSSVLGPRLGRASI